jgi:hypothetical protein
MEMTGDGVEFVRRAAVVRRHGSYCKEERKREMWSFESGEGVGWRRRVPFKGKEGVNAERTRLFISLDAIRVVSLLTRVV